MSNTVIVRDATTADLAAITAIYRPAVVEGTASFELDPPDDAEMGRRMAAVLAGGYPYLVATIAGRVVGYGAWILRDPEPGNH